MKAAITSLFILLVVSATHAQQNVGCEIHGMYSRSVTIAKIKAAKKLSDFVTGYPSNWITDYISSEVSVTGNGKDEKRTGRNEMLTTQQKSILNTAKIGSDIIVDVKYTNENAVTHEKTNRNMYVKMTVIPEYEAQFPGIYETYLRGDSAKDMATGTPQRKYLKENIIAKLSADMLKKLEDKTAKVIFAINEQGDITDTKMYQSSLDVKTDKIIMDAINKMPRWKPAQTANGQKVKQYFELVVGNTGC